MFSTKKLKLTINTIPKTVLFNNKIKLVWKSLLPFIGQHTNNNWYLKNQYVFKIVYTINTWSQQII